MNNIINENNIYSIISLIEYFWQKGENADSQWDEYIYSIGGDKEDSEYIDEELEWEGEGGTALLANGI
jgi:hypothetical protein